MKHILKYIPKKTTVIPCLIFSIALSATLIIGKSLYIYGNFNGIVSSGSALLSSALGMIGYTLLLTILFSIISEIIIRFQKRKITPRWKIFQHPWIYWPVIFLCWLPCYLAYYPGIISYDMHEQMAQAFGTVSYSKYHPPLHTFVWEMCLTIEKLTGFSGLVIYSILQMLLLSFAFTYMLRFFIKKNVGNILVLLTILFVCFNPVIAIFSFIPVKDALFTVFFILYCVELCDFICNKEAYSHNYFSIGRMILFSVLCCLLRNNMVYGLLVATIFMLLSLKKYWKNILVWNAIIIAIYGIINGPFYSMLGIKNGNSREMLSVPIQQITYVVTHYDGAISEDTIQRIDKYLPYEELPHLYNPRLADYAKVNFNTSNFEKDKGGFLKLWFDLFKEYPDEYLVAFLNLNLPYWYVNANSVDEYAKRDYIETYIMEPSVTNYEVVRDSKIPWLYEEYEMYAEYEFKNDSPIVKRFFSINTPIWLMLFGITVLFVYKRKDLLVIYAPAVCYWLTFMLGPVSNFRYVFPFVALYPLFTVLILDGNKIKQKSN